MLVDEHYQCTHCGTLFVNRRDSLDQKIDVYCPSCVIIQKGSTKFQVIMQEIPFHVYKATQRKQQYANLFASQSPPRPNPYSQQQTKGQQPNVTTQTQTKCRIWWDNDLQAYRCSTPYSKEFVEFVKIAIPVSDRAYDPTTKIWAFAEKYLDVISETAKKVWRSPGEVVIITRAQTQQASTSPDVTKQTPEQVLVEFVKLLSNDALIAAYRRACMELHPDKGGTMEKMALLNMYWDRIKTDKGIK